MTEREAELRGMRGAQQRLEQALAVLDDGQAQRPSLLPDWTVAHVLTHIARNADGLRGMVEGARRAEVAAMYPGGLDQRRADIEAGGHRGAAALVDDVLTSAAALSAAFDGLSAEMWDAEGRTVFGPVTMGEVPFRRWREVEVHHADLGLAYTWSDWPNDYVRRELHRLTMLWDSRRPMGLTGLPAEALAVDDHQRVAWLLGRTVIDGLGPAGLMG